MLKGSRFYLQKEQRERICAAVMSCFLYCCCGVESPSVLLIMLNSFWSHLTEVSLT